MKPKIEVSDNAFKITLPNTNVVSQNAVTGALTDKEKECYALFKTEKRLSRKQAQEALGISQLFAVRVLNGLAEKEMVKRVGSSKNTKYELN